MQFQWEGEFATKQSPNTRQKNSLIISFAKMVFTNKCFSKKWVYHWVDLSFNLCLRIVWTMTVQFVIQKMSSSNGQLVWSKWKTVNQISQISNANHMHQASVFHCFKMLIVHLVWLQSKVWSIHAQWFPKNSCVSTVIECNVSFSILIYVDLEWKLTLYRK